jgi:hypothetical protein
VFYVIDMHNESNFSAATCFDDNDEEAADATADVDDVGDAETANCQR